MLQIFALSCLQQVQSALKSVKEGREREREKGEGCEAGCVLSNCPTHHCFVGVGVREGAAWEPLQECFKHLPLLLSTLSYPTSKR